MLGTLRYLYTGSKDYAQDRAYYLDVLGAELVWEFHEFGTSVGGFKISDGPMVLLAGHRPAPSVLPVYQVASLDTTKAELSKRGWKPKAGPIEIPDGPAYIFEDPSGNETAIFEQTRPERLVESYREKTEKSNSKPSDFA